uniref:BZIP domain-containing protein n=1 Tax=Micromonas pusilla TaxID=38833 RepID=A0A7S0KFV8_MICPS
MPTRRAAAASATPGTLTGQISMSDVLLQTLGDEASMDAAQFSQRVGDLFKEQPAHGRGEGAPLSRQGSLGGGRSSGRSARITASNVSGDTSNSGKTAQEIWHDIMSAPPAAGDGPGWKRQQSATQGQAALGALASGLSGLGTLLQGGATLGSGAFPGGSLISQASLDKLVAEHPAKTVTKTTKEWVDLLVNSANPAPLRGIAGSQKVALENAALEVMASPPRGTRSKEKGPASPRKAGSTATAAAAAAKETKKRGRVAIESDRPIVNLPPKKKGRRRKGEVDTETEEEKRLRAEERQRKNRESAARSHRRKAQHAEELEKRARDQEKKISDLEKENAKLRRQLSEAKEKLKKGGLGSPGGSLKRTSSVRS